MSSVVELCVNGGVYDVYVVMIVPLRGAPGRLILAGVPWVTSWFLSILLGYNMERLSKLDYLVLYTKLSSCLWAHKSGRAGSREGGSSGRSGPPIGNGGDPGRWGPVGTHVSQALDRRVGEVAETKSRRCEVKTWRR
jgi:hypothetical protein